MTSAAEPTSVPSASSAASHTDAALDAALRELHREVLAQPLPPTLQQAAGRLQAAQAQAARGRHGAGLAAAWVLAFGVGWLAHAQWGPMGEGAALARRGVEHEFVRQAGFAYRLYQPEKRHPVEVAAAEQAHLVQWLSKRLERPLKIPDLQPQGFALVGGRLLPGAGGARAQFMFENPAGQRLTLYLGALEKTAAPSEQAQATEFRFEPEGAVPSFYWVEQGFGYALSGPVERATLMALARSVYAQLNPP